MKTRTIILASLLSLLASSCTEDKKKSANLDTTINTYATAYCEKMTTCCINNTWATQEACVAEFVAGAYPDPQDKFVLNESRATNCLVKLTQSYSGTCENSYTPSYRLSECKNITTGLQALEQLCADDMECVDGLYCGEGDICLAKSTSGQECDSNFDYPCVDGLICLVGDITSTCEQPFGLGDTCAFAYECGAGFDYTVWCINDVCATKGDIGDDSNELGDDCLSGVSDPETSKCIAYSVTDYCEDEAANI
jgi:hypothetical protein